MRRKGFRTEKEVRRTPFYLIKAGLFRLLNRKASLPPRRGRFLTWFCRVFGGHVLMPNDISIDPRTKMVMRWCKWCGTPVELPMDDCGTQEDVDQAMSLLRLGRTVEQQLKGALLGGTRPLTLEDIKEIKRKFFEDPDPFLSDPNHVFSLFKGAMEASILQQGTEDVLDRYPDHRDEIQEKMDMTARKIASGTQSMLEFLEFCAGLGIEEDDRTLLLDTLIRRADALAEGKRWRVIEPDEMDEDEQDRGPS